MNKKIKLLSLSFLSAMAITPVISLGANFYNVNENLSIEVLKKDERILIKDIDEAIKDEVVKLNNEYNDLIENKYQTKYFNEEFNLDLNLEFKLENISWTGQPTKRGEIKIINDTIAFKNDGEIKNKTKIMLDNGNIEALEGSHPDAKKFWNGSIDGFKKDLTLHLLFNNETSHELISNINLIHNLGNKRKVKSIYNSSFQLLGKTKYNTGNKITYSSNTAFFGLGGWDHNLIIKNNENITSETEKNFFKGIQNLISKEIVREIDSFTQEDSLKLFSFVFDNNYLPDTINVVKIANEDYIRNNKNGKLVKFSENFDLLRLFGELNRELNNLIQNVKKVSNTDIKNKINHIIEKIKIGNFKSNINKAVKDLKVINNEDFTSPTNHNLNDLLIAYKGDVIGLVDVFNTDFNKLLNILYNDGLINSVIPNETITSDIGSLYERILGWLSVNKISFKINGEVHNVFENGVINDIREKLAIFTHVNDDLEKPFIIDEINFTQPKKLDKNIFSESFKVESTSSGNSILDNFKNEFLTHKDYKIAYKRYFKEMKTGDVNAIVERSIPIPILPNHLSTYLHEETGDIVFKDYPLYNEVRQWISKNIGDELLKNISLYNASEFANDKHDLDFENSDLLKLLDLEYEDSEEFNQKVVSRLINENFNDDDGVFFVKALIGNWNGKETKLANGEKYIGDWKESDQKAFIDRINIDGKTNIIEIEPHNKDKTTGSFLLKVRTMRTNYIDNLETYNMIMDNFDDYFVPIIETYEVEDLEAGEIITKGKFIGYYTMTMPIDNDPFLEKIRIIANSSADGIFDYKNVIFNEENIKYEYEIKDQLEMLEQKVSQISDQYMEDKELERNPIEQEETNPIVPSEGNQMSIGLMMAIIIPIVVVAIIVTLITVKIAQDRKIKKELGGKK